MTFDPFTRQGDSDTSGPSVLVEDPQRFVLTLEDLTEPGQEVFWLAAQTQLDIAAVENAVRLEMAEAERMAQLSGQEHSVNIARASKEGRHSPEYQQLAWDIYRRALVHADLLTAVRGIDRDRLAARIVDEFLGLGPIAPIVADPLVTEVMVNRSATVFYEREGRLVECRAARFRSPEHLLNVVDRYLLAMNRSVTPKTPLVDGQLPDGSRINVTHPRVTGEMTVTVRRFPVKTWTLIDLIEREAMSEEMAVDLATLVRGRASMLVSGGTGSGKTTLLNAVSGCANLRDRIITIEDSRELRLHPSATNVVHMEAVPGGVNLEPVTMQLLVKNALRMRPDRIIVGEIRDGVIVDMLQAASTGHEGSMSTIHANSVSETISRIVLLMARSGVELTDERMMDAIGLALEVIVAVRRFPDGSRRVTEIDELTYDRESHRITFNPLWRWVEAEQCFTRTGQMSPALAAHVGTYCGEPVAMDDLRDIAEQARRADLARLVALQTGAAS